MIFHTEKLVSGIEFGMARKQSEIQQSNLDSRPYLLIVPAPRQIVKGTAQIDQGTLYPIMFIDDLQFKIDDTAVIQERVHIQKKSIVINRCPKHDRLGDTHGMNLLGDIWRSEQMSAASMD